MKPQVPQTNLQMTKQAFSQSTWPRRIKAIVPAPGAVPNEGPLQSYNQLTEIFHSHQLRTPKTAGPGAAAPVAPLNAALNMTVYTLIAYSKFSDIIIYQVSA